MIHITVGIAQFFVLLIEQMAIVFLGVFCAGFLAVMCMLMLWRHVSGARRAKAKGRSE